MGTLPGLTAPASLNTRAPRGATATIQSIEFAPPALVCKYAGPMATVLVPVKRGSAPAGPQVYARLRAAIIAAEFEPGRQLSENELAARLGVSRTPVREALARLREERLVEIVPQLGT